MSANELAPLFGSLLIILLCLVLAHFGRVLVEKFLSERPPLVRELALEAIAAAELCGCCFELIIVADNFGVKAYAKTLFLLTIWWSWNWGDASACPYTHLEDWVEGKTELRVVGLKTLAQIIGGVAIFKYVQLIWGLEMLKTHKDRAYGECTADLQVSVFLGALIEGFATCICRVASRLIADRKPRFATALDAFIGTSLVVAAFDTSGGYFNPVLATSLKLGCKGHTWMEHTMVYWMGACIGAVASVFVYRLVRAILPQPQIKEE